MAKNDCILAIEGDDFLRYYCRNENVANEVEKMARRELTGWKVRRCGFSGGAPDSKFPIAIEFERFPSVGQHFVSESMKYFTLGVSAYGKDARKEGW